MNKKCIKIIKFSIVICFFIIILKNVCYASGYLDKFQGTTTGEDAKIKSIISMILGGIRTIGAGVAVIILLFLGCKYMLASANDRAEIKKYAVTYVIGAIVLFSSSAIISIIKNFVDQGLKGD